jgi:phage shock protein A
MTDTRPRGVFARIHALFAGMLAIWVRDREHRNPQAVYEQAITDRMRQYVDLKQAVAGILYMRNKLEGELLDGRSALARTLEDIRRAVARGDDGLALRLIEHKHALGEDVARAERELGKVRAEAEEAKQNLARFRDEIRTLEREKLHALATLANARARRRVQVALSELSVEADLRALDGVREHIAKLGAEGQLDAELGADPLGGRLAELRREAREDAARRELEELKLELATHVLPRSATAVAVPVG